MQTHNWNTVGIFLIAVALQISGLHSWTEVKNPAFIAGLLVAAGSVLKGMIQPGPTEKP